MVFDSLMKEIKKFCKDDENCVLIILVLTGFLLCMFFNRQEGFELSGAMAPVVQGPDNEGPMTPDQAEVEQGGQPSTAELLEKEGIPAQQTDEVLGMKPQQNIPQNGYGSANGPVKALREQPQMEMQDKFPSTVQEGKLIKIPSAYLELPATAGYPFTELMGKGLPSKWPQDRPIGLPPTPIDTPGPTEGPPSSEEGTAPGPSSGPGAQKVMTLVLFYAPWCGHSRNMLEDYDAVIEEYHGKTKDGVTYEVIKIDMDKDKDAAKRHEVEVRGFPTLYTFYAVGDKKISNVFPYRTKDKIIEELEKRGMAMK